VQLNKRTVHRQMEYMGMRAGLRAGTELCSLGTHQQSFHEFMKKLPGGLTKALQERDEKFGDYRTGEERDS
jgi:enoyl-CoA hydratase